MGLRDLVMIILGLGCIPFALYSPFYGLLAYCWLSFMKPQSLAWSPDVRAARITLVVAIVLIARALTIPGPRWRLRGPTLVFIAFWFWVLVSTLASSHSDLSWIFLERFSKIGIAVLLLTGLVRTRDQLKWLVVLLAICPGIYALRLGVHFFRIGGATHHGGPMGMDNNDLALFVAMGVPMLVFAAADVRSRWARGGLYAMAALAIPAVIIGESRGGMLALAGALLVTIWRRTNLAKTVLAVAILLPLILAIMPAGSRARYETLGDYRQDKAAMDRIYGWDTAQRMADANPLTGVGLGMHTFLAEYDNYKANPEDQPRVAHSVWYSVLGGAGYPGLILYLLLMAATVRTTWRVRRLAIASLGGKQHWAWRYAAMIECAMVAFAIGATFLSQVGFEYVFALYLLSVPLEAIAVQEAAKAAAPTAASRAAEPPPDALPALG